MEPKVSIFITRPFIVERDRDGSPELLFTRKTLYGPFLVEKTDLLALRTWVYERYHENLWCAEAVDMGSGQVINVGDCLPLPLEDAIADGRIMAEAKWLNQGQRVRAVEEIKDYSDRGEGTLAAEPGDEGVVVCLVNSLDCPTVVCFDKTGVITAPYWRCIEKA